MWCMLPYAFRARSRGNVADSPCRSTGDSRPCCRDAYSPVHTCAPVHLSRRRQLDLGYKAEYLNGDIAVLSMYNYEQQGVEEIARTYSCRFNFIPACKYVCGYCSSCIPLSVLACVRGAEHTTQVWAGGRVGTPVTLLVDKRACVRMSRVCMRAGYRTSRARAHVPMRTRACLDEYAYIAAYRVPVRHIELVVPHRLPAASQRRTSAALQRAHLPHARMIHLVQLCTPFTGSCLTPRSCLGAHLSPAPAWPLQTARP